MNERIKNLYTQAYENVVNYTPSFLVTSEMIAEKFAELIVRECRDIVAKTRDQAIEDGWNIDEAMCTAMYDIDEQFGRLK